MNKDLIKWRVIAAIFIIIVGTLFHFIYQWSGNNKTIALIAAVNESVWEHLKLAFWPALIFYLFEACFIGQKTSNFMTSKAVSLFLMPMIIVVLFYGYKAILGHNYLPIDISIFVIAIIIGEIVGYKITQLTQFSKEIEIGAFLFIGAMFYMFVTFTYFPPNCDIFRSAKDGAIGLNNKIP